MCLSDNIPYGSLPQFSQGSIDGPCDARDGWLVIFLFFFFFRFLQLVFLIIPNVNVAKYSGLVGAILLGGWLSPRLFQRLMERNVRGKAS